LVAQQVAVRPEATALVVDNQRLSYGELNRRANQLAHYLQMLGVRPNVLVGLLLERSTDMVVGLLGILKAGGAYVPRVDAIFPDPLFPTAKALRHDWKGIFHWSASVYVLGFYPGKSTFFFFRTVVGTVVE
jgi:non-ribosomal peptide synthetase component F